MEMKLNNIEIVREFELDCRDLSLYVAGYDPYKKYYTPCIDLLKTLLELLGFNRGYKTEKLYLGEDCTLLLDVSWNCFLGKPNDGKGVMFWVDVRILNSEILPDTLEGVKLKYDFGETILIPIGSEAVKELEATLKWIVTHTLEMFKTKIWPYREELIEFIKQNS